MSKSKEVTSPSTANLPAHLKDAQSGAGNENITSDDLELPRLKLLQALSPEVAEGGDEQIAGAKPGMTVNTMTGEIMDDFYAINVFFNREYAVFRDRTLGGDGVPLTVEATEEAAKNFITENGLSLDEFNVTETARHLLLICEEDGTPKYEALVLMSATRLRFSSEWNSQIVATGMDRYAGMWKISPKRVSNSKGSWFSYTVDFANWADPAAYEQAKAMYAAVSGSQAAAA